MKTVVFALLKCVGGGNTCLAECKARDVIEATQKLQEHCPVSLRTDGYAKQEEISFVVGEIYNPLN